MHRITTDGLPELLGAAGVAGGLPYRVVAVTGTPGAVMGWPQELGEASFSFVSAERAQPHPWLFGGFDVAVCLDVLHRVEYWECLIANLAAALHQRGGGTQALLVRCREAPVPRDNALGRRELAAALRFYFRASLVCRRRSDDVLFAWARGVKHPAER